MTTAPSPKTKILAVDDRADGLMAIEAVLDSPAYQLIKASSGEEAISCLLQHKDIAVILLDVQMPVMNGFETAKKMMLNEDWKNIPIIFLTAISKEVTHIYRGYECGAVDYLFKPFDPWILKSKVAFFVELHLKNQKILEQSRQLQENERRERERRVAELELESLRRYRNLADAIPHIIWKGKPDGNLNYFNQVWYEYTGLTVEQSRDKGWQAAVDSSDRERFLLIFKNATEGVLPFEIECRIRRFDGISRWHLIRGTFEKQRNGDPTSWIWTCTDIHDRKETEEKLKKAQEELEHRVQERTVELSLTNQALHLEMAERMRAQKEILEISEKEQKRIGQDLHDGLAQQLAGISFKSKILQQKLSRKSVEEAEDAYEILALIVKAIGETKRLARGFYPIELERHGLFSALKELAINTEKMFHIVCQCQWDPAIKMSNLMIESHLYRIVQEAIHNAIKHGKAKRVQVSVMRNEDLIAVSVQNDGEGISHVPSTMIGMGLRTMSYRAKMIGASLNIQKRPEGGTCVSLSFALPEERMNENQKEDESIPIKNGAEISD